MWTFKTTPHGQARVTTLWAEGTRVTLDQVLEGWEDPACADRFSAELASTVWPAFFWECPPVSVASLDEPFAFARVQSAVLARVPPDPSAFRGHFRRDQRAVVFANLGGDATLVAPCPGHATASSAHLGAFLRNASAGDARALWRSVADAVRGQLDDRPLWVSTSGLGVSWVHIRLDRRPKYYTHAPYRMASLAWARSS